jgi:hypothetical protein
MAASPYEPGPRPKRVRLGFLIGGILLMLVAAAVIAGGVLLFWLDGEKDADGYFTTSTERFATRSHGFATQSLDVELGGAGRLVNSGEFGTLRLRARSLSGKPIFIGIGRTATVERYLRGVAHTTVTDISTDPFSADVTEHGGSREPRAPGKRKFWAAFVEGDGRRSLTWTVEDGHWSAVLMNADGSAGVGAAVSAGAKIGLIRDVAWIAVVAGGVLALLAALLVVLGLRPRRPPAATGAPA